MLRLVTTVKRQRANQSIHQRDLCLAAAQLMLFDASRRQSTGSSAKDAVVLASLWPAQFSSPHVAAKTKTNPLRVPSYVPPEITSS